MSTSATYINAAKADLEEARRWGDIGEIARLSEEIREWEEYRDHCDDMRADWERQDARFSSYWEARL